MYAYKYTISKNFAFLFILQVSVLLRNNSIFCYELNISNNVAELVHSIVLPGHRSIVKSLNYSSDNFSILSLSNESAKIWRK